MAAKKYSCDDWFAQLGLRNPFPVAFRTDPSSMDLLDPLQGPAVAIPPAVDIHALSGDSTTIGFMYFVGDRGSGKTTLKNQLLISMNRREHPANLVAFDYSILDKNLLVGFSDHSRAIFRSAVASLSPLSRYANRASTPEPGSELNLLMRLAQSRLKKKGLCVLVDNIEGWTESPHRAIDLRLASLFDANLHRNPDMRFKFFMSNNLWRALKDRYGLNDSQAFFIEWTRDRNLLMLQQLIRSKVLPGSLEYSSSARFESMVESDAVVDLMCSLRYPSDVLYAGHLMTLAHFGFKNGHPTIKRRLSEKFDIKTAELAVREVNQRRKKFEFPRKARATSSRSTGIRIKHRRQRDIKIAERAVCAISANGFGFLGTGFLVSSNQILTCEHVLKPDKGLFPIEEVTATFDYLEHPTEPHLAGVQSTRQVRSSSFRVDHKLDCAIITLDEIQSGLLNDRQPLEFHVDSVGVGDKVWVIGHPDGDPLSSTIEQDTCVIFVGSDFVAYDCDTLPGMSGSPVILNEKNTVVAMHLGDTTNNVEGKAGLKSSLIRAWLNQEARREASRPRTTTWHQGRPSELGRSRKKARA